MNLLFVVDEYRGEGYGRKLTKYWEKKMLGKGYSKVMLSTASDEYSQHFYRKLAYRDIGGFTMPNEPLELLMVKELV